MKYVRHSERRKSLLRSLALIALMVIVTGCSNLFGTGGNDPSPSLFSVSGRVYETSEENLPVVGAEVWLGDLVQWSDSDGRFAFTHVPVSGSPVTLRVEADDYAPYISHIDPKAGETVFLQVELLPVQTSPGKGDGSDGDEPDPGDGPIEPGDGSTEPGDGPLEPGDGSTEPGDGDGSTDPGDGTPDPGDGSTDPSDGSTAPPMEPDYAGAVAVSIKIVNAPSPVAPSDTTSPARGFEAVRPVSVLRRTSVNHHVPGEWIVELDGMQPVQPTGIRWDEAGVRLLRQLSDNFYLVVADEANAFDVEARLSAMPGVASVGRNRLVSPIALGPVVPNDEYFFRQWSLPLIGAPYAWTLTTGSRHVVVAVLDTGLVPHDDIDQGRLVYGRNFVGDQTTANYRDNTNNFSHGTMVAGIIGARSDNRTGITGLNWDVTLMPVRVMSSNGGGNIAGVGDGIKWAVDNGAHIINMSLAWDSNPNDAGERYVRQQIERAAARGVLMIAGAGNDNGRVTMPAAHPDVIAVGAVDKNKRRAWYSNYGNQLDIVAPGGDQPTDALYRDGVLSTDVASGRPYYTYSIGTSFASPHVTGVAALMYSRGITDPQEIREILLDTAEDLGSPGYDIYYGHGLVNAYAAVAGLRRTDALVGVATDSGQVFGPVHPEPRGETSIALVEGVAPGQQTVFAWIDVNRDGRLDEGDFAAYTTVRVPKTGTVETELRLQIVDTLSTVDKARLQHIIHP